MKYTCFSDVFTVVYQNISVAKAIKIIKYSARIELYEEKK